MINKLNLEKEFDKKFGFIKKHKIDTEDNYNKIKNFYVSQHLK